MPNSILSILCPSYNHEKYVKFFINSLLAQTNPNWELIIVDDCSTDNNVTEIKKFKDKRIKLIKNPFNMGINYSLNTAFKHASGDFIAFSASDDMFTDDFVETILNTFNTNPDKDVIYSDLQIMNHDGTIQKNIILKQSKADRNTLLRHMFFVGNNMLSPGTVFRKAAFAKIYPLPIPLSQYQDYQINVNAMLHLNVMTIDKRLVLYRKPSNKSGISVNNKKTLRTRQLEENLLMDSFLQINNVNTLREIFGADLLKPFEKMDKKFIPYYLGMLALDAVTEYKKVWGYNQIVKFITNPKNYISLNKRYGFCYQNFLDLSDKFTQSATERKYKRYKKLFNISIILICILICALICII